MVDITDLKSVGLRPWEFKSPRPHHLTSTVIGISQDIDTILAIGAADGIDYGVGYVFGCGIAADIGRHYALGADILDGCD